MTWTFYIAFTFIGLRWRYCADVDATIEFDLDDPFIIVYLYWDSKY